MGLSYSQCVYAEPSPSTDDVQLVPLGCRGRLYSLWIYPTGSGGASPSDCIFILRDGDSSGETLIVVEYSGLSFGQSGVGPLPLNFIRHGILFTNGVNAESSTSGVDSVSITYTGVGDSGT